MASKNLGQLTLDLVANIGGFTGPLDKAQREADKRAKEFARTQKGNERAVANTLTALDKQVLVLGKTAKEQKLMELAARGATKAQLEQAEASLDAIKAFEDQQKAMKDNIAFAKKAGAAIGAAFVAAGAAVAANVVHVVNSAKEIENLSRVANESAENFQRIAYAAKPFGVEQEKLADILKDVNDKVGDFITTGQGPMADFFEKIGPKVGVTAEHFRNLSGSEALGLYIKSLEQAGVSQAEMTFFMEAIASDATLLLPLFKDNARELGRLTDEADRFGVALSDVDVARLKEADEVFRQLAAQGKVLSQEVALATLPAIQELAEIIKDPALLQAVHDLAGAVGAAASGGAALVVEFTSMRKQLGLNLAAITGNAAEFDILEQNIKDVDRALRGGLSTPIKFLGTPDEDLKKLKARFLAERDALLSEFDGKPVDDIAGLKAVISDLDDELAGLKATYEAMGPFDIDSSGRNKLALEAYIDQLEITDARLDEFYKKSSARKQMDVFPGLQNDPFESTAPVFAANDPYSPLTESAQKYLQALEKQKALSVETTELAKVNFEIQSGALGKLTEAQQQVLRDRATEIDQLKAQQKEAEELAKIQQASADYIASVQQQIALLDAETEAEKILYEVQSGRYAMLDQTQKDALVRQAQMLDDARAQIEAEREYKQLIADVMTDEEKRTAQLRERLAVIDAMDQVSYADKEQVFGRVIQTSFDTDPDKAKGDDFEGQREALQEWYSEQLDMLEKFRAERADLNAQWDEQEEATRAEYENRLTEINTQAESERRQQMADGFSALLGVASKYYDGMEGEEAAYTRAALQLGQVLLDEKKRESFQSIVASTHSAAMGAYESLASIPYIGPVLGAAAAAGIYVAGGAASAAVLGMAHDGIDSVPQTGTWLLEKGERVTTAETSAKLDATLDRVAQGQGGSGDVVVNVIEDRDRAGQSTQRTDPGNEQTRIIDVFVSNIQSDGRAAQAIQNKWGLSPRGR